MRYVIPNDSLDTKLKFNITNLKLCGFSSLRQEQIDHTAGFTQVAEKEHGEINKMETEFNKKKTVRCLGLCIRCNAKYVHVQQGGLDR